eukprot:Hpha_TRINITY_DN15841_c6_g7::TRINITY_DN15841_c6_g7_i1::g.191120::m.191120
MEAPFLFFFSVAFLAVPICLFIACSSLLNFLPNWRGGGGRPSHPGGVYLAQGDVEPGEAAAALDAQLSDLQGVLDGWRQLEQQFNAEFDSGGGRYGSESPPFPDNY